MTGPASDLRSKIDRREAVVGIVGLGYVGLPLALSFAEAGFPVLGFDVDLNKVERLTRAESYIAHIGADRIARQIEQGRLAATDDMGRFDEPDAILICVPTPLGEDRAPDLRFVTGTAQQIAKELRPGQLVVLESTTYPGTTDGPLREALETSKLRAGRDFFLAFSPEREDPGNPSHTTTTIPKVVGGVDPESGDLAEALYSAVVVEVVRVSDAATAEATKLVENTYRAVNIALVNELKIVYDALGVDIWEVLDAAETKPFGFQRFNPGPGWGGHCIPIDPFYLSWQARRHGVEAKFIELAGVLNARMPEYVVEKLRAGLAALDQRLAGSRVLLLGLAYKKNVADPRESPAFELIDLLRKQGASVAYHDPHVPEAPPMRSWRDLPALRSVPLDAEALRSFDAVIVVTDHDDVDYDLVQREARLLVDTRGVYRQPADRLIRA